MKFEKKLTAVGAVALALAIAACSSSSDDGDAVSAVVIPPVAPPPPPPPPPASDVTQVGEDDATAVTAVRDSDGDLKGIKVGETEISTIRFAQNKGMVETNLMRGSMPAGKAAKIGIIAANDGIMTQHAESYATTSTAMKVKINNKGTPMDDSDDIVALDFSDVDMEDPGGMPISVPSGIDEDKHITMVKDHLYEPDEGQTIPTFNLDNKTGALKKTVIVSTGMGDKMKYYVQVKVVTKAEADEPTSDYYGYAVHTELYVEVPAVMVKDTTKLDRDKVMGFDYLAYGVWAKIDDKDMPTELGNGYLIADPSMLTSADSMPVTGTASFEGQYVSYVRKMVSTGPIKPMDGDATMVANFGKDAMSVTLVDQFGAGKNLILTGTIDGNTFAGTGMGAKSDGGTYLDVDDAIAEMSGGFYGEKVDEAGGVYDVLGGSDRNPGRVVGAFGGVNTGN